MGSALTEQEKLSIRETTIQHFMHQKGRFSESILRSAILKESHNGCISGSEMKAKLKSSLALKRNCLSRTHKRCAWVPSHFGVKLFLNENGLSRIALKELQTAWHRTKKIRGSNLGERIPNTSATIWKVHNYDGLQKVIKESKQKLHCAMLKSARVKHQKKKQNAIYSVLERHCPSEIDFIKYKPHKMQGTGWHEDGLAIFGTVLIVLQDSVIGRLHVQGIDIPENLQPGDVVVLDPIRVHRVQEALRSSERRVATIVL